MQLAYGEAKDFVRAAIRADIPVVLWGAPGVGKTSLVRAAARELGMPCGSVAAATLQVEDLAGYPRVPKDGQHVEQLLPAWMRRLPIDERACVLLIDDIADAHQLVQAAAFRLVLERAIGDIPVPNLRVVAAGNPADMSAMGGSIPPALANRFAHVLVRPSPDEWRANAREFERDERVRREIDWIAFACELPWKELRAPFVLEDDDVRNDAFPSPRAWHMAARLTVAGVDRVDAAAACCGTESARAILCVLGRAELPEYGDWRAVLASPQRTIRRIAVLAARAGIDGVPPAWQEHTDSLDELTTYVTDLS